MMGFDWDLRSVVLSIAAVQALVVSSMLFRRNARSSDRLLALFLLAISATMSEHIAGWLGLYINQRLTFFPFGECFLFAPLAFLYVKSVVNSNYQWHKKEALHFLPAAIYFSVHFFVWFHPLDEKQLMMSKLYHWKWLEIKGYSNAILFTVYLYKIIKHFTAYLKWLPDQYSNIEKLSLHWIRNFIILLGIYYLVFIGFGVAGLLLYIGYDVQFWQFFMLAIIIYYTSATGYAYTRQQQVVFDMANNTVPASVTVDIDPERKDGDQNAGSTAGESVSPAPGLTNNSPAISAADAEALYTAIVTLMENEKPYLNPELSLSQLSLALNKPPYIVTQFIRQRFDKNFNDLINGYRVEEVIKKLQQGEYKTQTLLGIAFDCGFNSKATFNRAFKKAKNSSPKSFIKPAATQPGITP
jgi:AraC-like DNA-binding protein